jgi:serine phosphatase RsbU (regulator of sigma subunit)
LKTLWNSISFIGAAKLKDPADLRQLSLLNRIAVFGSLVLSTYIPISILLDVPEMAMNVAAGISMCMLVLVINSRGHFRLARVLFLVVTVVFVSFILFISGKDAGSQVVLVLIGALHLVLFRSTRWSIVVLLIIIAVFAFTSYWVETHVSRLDHLGPGLKRFSFYLTVASTTVLVFAMVLYFKNTMVEYEATITRKNDEITQKNKDITDSIHYAKRIQQAILPSPTLVRESFPQSFIFYRPKDIVAGDFYWLEKAGGKTFFTVADCTGHGVPGAMVSVICSNALGKAVKELGVHRPSLVLDKTVELLEAHFSKSSEDVNDGMDLAFCCYDEKSRTLEYAGANNGLYLIRNGQLTEYKPDKQPVGRHYSRRAFTNHQISLEPGDCIYIFSDGMADQFGGPKGKKFKYSQLKELLLKIHTLPVEEQERALADTFVQWKGGLEQVDDVCVMGIRI